MALAYVFAATAFVSSGISALLPTMLTQYGATPATALLAGMLIGPAQVAARILEAGWLSRYHPLVSARLATLMNPIGVLTLLIGGPVVAPLFAVLYGAATAFSPSRAARCHWPCSAPRVSASASDCSRCRHAPPAPSRRWRSG